MNPVYDITKGAADSIFGKGVELIDNLTLSKEEKAQKKIEWEKLHFDLVKDIQAADILVEQTMNEDRKASREFAMQQINSKDWFGRNFMHMLAGFTVVNTIVFGYALFILPIPEANRNEIQMLFHTLLIASCLAVYNFYFGSSKSSKDKTDIIARVASSEDIDKYLESRKDRKIRLRREEKNSDQ